MVSRGQASPNCRRLSFVQDLQNDVLGLEGQLDLAAIRVTL